MAYKLCGGTVEMISIIIPSRNELFLTETIQGILQNADGEIEIIAHIDEKWPYELDPPKNLITDPRVQYIHPLNPVGMRGGINSCVKKAKGKYILKTDGHCLFAPGFDTVLQSYMEDNWIVIPGRHSLDATTWTIEQNGKPRRDYHYLCYPNPIKDHDMGMHGVEWRERNRERLAPEYDIDETMSFQGSCWFMTKDWFTDFIKGMNNFGYGVFAQEPQEIGLKTWLGGGKVMVNKKTWYAHLHKGHRYGRMYRISQREIVNGHNYSANYWMNNLWEDRIHNIDWLIERFWPVPTWADNWKELWAKWLKHE
jgi:glycosyltransferase involved in cell wall biosynthesis